MSGGGVCLKDGEGRTEINLVCHLEMSTGTLTWGDGFSVLQCLLVRLQFRWDNGKQIVCFKYFLWVERSEDRFKNWELDGQTETYSASKDTTTGYDFMLKN